MGRRPFSQDERQRAGRDERGRPDQIEVEPRAATDADADPLEHPQRHKRRDHLMLEDEPAWTVLLEEFGLFLNW